ncbi:MAG: 2-amino-4-hydroxy-6-hydroxymethyldihydropteridine diphosphokinase, partial [Duncaniella sp.]|nr:2-amino-4-hydroxy-6-hydroxymethyldihydropteridine diphosphokinase [Duncaniella sp.]
MTVHLNLGSNLGDRREMLARAAEAVAEALPGRWAVSDPVESEPWGFASPHPFINIGMKGELDVATDPLVILDTLHAIERRLSPAPHRDASGAYIDRALDIDIISVDDPDPILLP